MKTVSVKWQTEGDLTVLYLIGDILVYYLNDKDPNFKRNQRVSLEEVLETKPYKAIKFENSLPPDAYLDLTFGWSKGVDDIDFVGSLRD